MWFPRLKGFLSWVMKKRVVAVLPIAALWGSQSLAQSGTPISDTDLSKETENPVTRQITLPLRYEADFLDGAYKATMETFEIDQAVVPFRLNDDWALITRTKLPAEAQPPKNLGDHWVEGLSNGYTTFFLSPEHGSGFYWGVGPVLYYPTATNWRSALTNGAPARQRHSCTRTRAHGCSARSSTISGPLAGRPAAVTERTSFCSILC
jgi:hypothetical protein